MASQPGSKPEPGAILIVIHDFQARSSDELTLIKGDHVELIERDDEYSDGWYLGRHVENGNSGLFPEVYTRPAPKITPAAMLPMAISIPRPAEATTTATETAPTPAAAATEVPIVSDPQSQPLNSDARLSVPTPEADRSQHQAASRHVSASELQSPVTQPLAATSKDATKVTLPQLPVMPAATIQPGQDSPVLNETLTVIQEHISDMHNPRYAHMSDRRGNDSGSEYSSNLDQRMSYINGEETDEEEMMHSEAEVSQWSPNDVAGYLESVGVDPKHCEVFREQEITGDVLLGMDQTSVFLKEFELGSVGRRLKTWQKIKALQDEVKSRTPPATRRSTRTYSEATSESSKRGSISGRASGPRAGRSDTLTGMTPIVSAGVAASPTKVHEHRPSAASIRDMHHSRRPSSTDFGAGSLSTMLTLSPSSSHADHKKQPSFDRNWSLGAAMTPERPLSATFHNTAFEAKDMATPVGSQIDLDRGYFSGGENDDRKRNVLRKRDSGTLHSRNSSYADEQRIRSATALARHSRFGSMDSARDRPTTPTASQKYYGASSRGSRRTGSTDTGRHASLGHSTSVYRPERMGDSPLSPERPDRSPDWSSTPLSGAQGRGLGLRAVSEATALKATVDAPLNSPARTGSTQSGKGSLDSDPADHSKYSLGLGAGSRSRRKSKKETSAYTRGLEKKTPHEQMQDCDYSGWMKKKSTNLMTTWKPRLFVLRGRRLSYYYSEDDTEEKGLIDISFHRVLPADNDRLTGLHATITGATSSPTNPSTATQTQAAADAAAEPESTLSKGGGDATFIFKLVPPRAGLSRAVTFTKPTVHYFAVPNIKQGRLWMAALMKATIDRDDSQPISTTYQQKTISLAKARAMRHRPPALMNLDEKAEEEIRTPAVDLNGLNISGIIFDDKDVNEGDSGVSGVSKHDSKQIQSAPSSASHRSSDMN